MNLIPNRNINVKKKIPYGIDKITARLNELKEDLKLSECSFAELLGINQVNVHRYLKGRMPPVDIIATICYRLNISEKWLLYGRGSKNRDSIISIGEESIDEYGKHKKDTSVMLLVTRDEAEKESFRKIERVENYVPIKLLSDQVAGGDPREVNENDIESFTVIYESWVKKTGIYSSIRVKGDSMSPVLNDGDIISINHARTDPIELHGKIVVASIPFHGVTVKYLNEMPDCWVLEPANPLSHIIYADKSQSKIIGAVEWAWRKFE